MKLVLELARVSFAQGLFEPKENENGKKRWNASFLIPKGGDDVTKCMDVMKKVAAEKWKDKGLTVLKGLLTEGKTFLHDGDTKADKYDGYEGMMYVSAGSYTQPKVLDKDKLPTTAEEGKIYSGCYAFALLDVYAQDNKYGKRINCGIRGVMFVKDGDAFVGASPAKDDEFPDLADVGENEENIDTEDISSLIGG